MTTTPHEPTAHRADAADIEPPPTTFLGTLGRLGPGMIIAGSIVGSGELIATTKVGAEAGFYLLWLIIVGCAIKVFAQVEIGRFTVAHSRTSLDGLNLVPGPRARVNWIVIGWALMTCLIVSQQGGIVGGVGQSLAMSVPLTQRGEAYNAAADELIRLRVAQQTHGRIGALAADAPQRIASLQATLDQIGQPHDEILWAVLVAIATSVMLYFGRYKFIEIVSTVLVAGFTAVTLLTLVMIQFKSRWAVTGSDLAQGLSLGLPPAREGYNPLLTALGAFGIIGVGTSELIMYPYWCMEKGYARSTGPNDGTAAWIERARGWMRVMRTDAFCSMAVYTLATVGFYLLGATVLGRVGLNPVGSAMVRTLAEMYVPVFGPWAHGVFLFGAFAVLYSTFFVAAGGNARIVVDGMGLVGVIGRDEPARRRWVRLVSAAWPLVAVALFAFVRSPVRMVLASGLMQALMLPAIGGAALYFRYRHCHPSLRPGPAWDVMLWISFAGMLVVGVWTAIQQLPGLFF